MGAEDEATRSILIEGKADLPEEQVGSRANSDDQSTPGQCFRELRLVRGTGTLERRREHHYHESSEGTPAYNNSDSNAQYYLHMINITK